MAVPPSVTRVTSDGVEFTSSVDRIQYTIDELVRAALRDTAKLLRKRLIQAQKQLPGMRDNRRLYKSTQYWVRRRETDLQIGFKHDSWYGADSELGVDGQPIRGFLRNTVYDNIALIRQIQSQYLSAITDGDSALNLTDEEEIISPDGDDSA